MNELIEASLRFPTVVFTIGLGIALLYWLFVLLGALDIDILGGGHAADSITGGAKGGAEALKGIKVDAEAGGVWDGLGLAAVPITITLSIILLVGWCGSLLLMEYGGRAFGATGWLPGAIMVVMVVVAVLVTSVAVRPLAPVFAVKEGKSNRDYIGHNCTISTGHVDDGFGQATVEDGGTVLVIAVRCDRPGRLQRGDSALIIDFDVDRQAYVVEPSTDILARTGKSGQPA